MINFFEKFKMPTLLGLGVIFLGIGAGLFLILRDQTFISSASPNTTPQNVTFSNIEDTTTVVSWQTAIPVASFITFGQNSPQGRTVNDDRDLKAPLPHSFHYVTLKNLLPKTEYQLKIQTGRNSSDIFKFQTASPANLQNNFGPIVGSVLGVDKPLDEGIAYLAIAGASLQSSLIKNLGSFLLPLPKIRKSDLSDVLSLNEDMVAKLTIIGKEGQSSVLFELKADGVTLPAVKLGQNLDLTNPLASPKPASPSASELKTFDLNSDGKINATDNAIILRNFGKNPKEKKADLNSDGVVDQKDLDLMSQKISGQISL